MTINLNRDGFEDTIIAYKGEENSNNLEFLNKKEGDMYYLTDLNVPVLCSKITDHTGERYEWIYLSPRDTNNMMRKIVVPEDININNKIPIIQTEDFSLASITYSSYDIDPDCNLFIHIPIYNNEKVNKIGYIKLSFLEKGVPFTVDINEKVYIDNEESTILEFRDSHDSEWFCAVTSNNNEIYWKIEDVSLEGDIELSSNNVITERYLLSVINTIINKSYKPVVDRIIQLENKLEWIIGNSNDI